MLLQNLVYSLCHWQSFYFQCGAHPVTLCGGITYPFLIVGMLHVSGLFCQHIFNTIFHFSLFLPAIRLKFLFPDWYTLLYIAVDWNSLLFCTCDFFFVSVGPSYGVTFCHMMFSLLRVVVPLLFVTASFPVACSSPHKIILFLTSRPSFFVRPVQMASALPTFSCDD